jgi:hypothetical protein
MSMHKVPLTDLEREGLINHHLPIGEPSITADCFRAGIAWVLRQQLTKPADEVLIEALRQCEADWARSGWGYNYDTRKKVNDALNTYKPADDTISVSKGEWEAMKKDAERYRFIIKRGLIQIFDRKSSVSYKPKEDTDAAIDQAISEDKHNG